MTSVIILIALGYSLSHLIYTLYNDIVVKILSNILIKRLATFCSQHLKEIEVSHTYGYYNSKCHWNSYNEYIMNKDEVEVVAVICTSKRSSNSFIHFINYHKRSNSYYDITLGTAGTYYDNYYKVGFCDFSDDENMGARLDEFKYWAIDRCFKNKIVRKLYKKLQSKYEII